MRDQNTTPLFTALQNYMEKKVIPFDVPGHKYGKGSPILTNFFGETTLKADVNSMKPLDNICNPTGVIREAELLLADAYQADYAYFLVNGTTSGIQTMIMSACQPGDKIIMPRNVHKSALNGLILSGALPVYVQPEIDDDLGIANNITVEGVQEAIENHPDAKAVFVINPTYYGMTSDLKSIVTLAHENQMVVLVDEAHGAHFPFHPDFPKSAMSLGADMATVSLHKTGGSLTQSSALLLNEKRFLSREEVKTILNLSQTTSGSYLLMSSLDVARRMLATEGKQILQNALDLARYARDALNNMDGYYAFGKELIGKKGIYALDETKLGIKVSDLGVTGLKVYDLLRDEYNIQVEFGDTHNILVIISVGDTKENVDQLLAALSDIGRRYQSEIEVKSYISLHYPQVIVTPRNAFYAQKRRIPLIESEGEISGESVMMYPPGIPFVSPGERIDRGIIDYIQFLKQEHCVFTGAEDQNIEYIKVLGRD